MDNDRKIDALIAQSRSTFLQELGREFQERQKRYNLEEEFSKTRKNRSILVPLSVLGVTILLLGSAFFMASWIQQQTISMDVGIETAFSDVNLRDVLDTVKRNETEMQQAQERLREILTQKDRRIQTAQTTAQRESQLLGTRGLSSFQQNQQNAIINSNLEAELEAIDGEFAPLISEAEAVIAEIQVRIDQYDARQLELARAQEEVLNNQQRLFDLERQRINQTYQSEIASLRESHANEILALENFQVQLEESLTQRFRAEQAAALSQQFNRFNPVFEEETIQEILVQRSGTPGSPELNMISHFVEIQGVDTSDLQSRLTEVETELEILLRRIEDIPYGNSLPQAFGSVRQLIVQGFSGQNQYQSRLARIIEQQRDEITQSNRVVSQVSELQGDVQQLGSIIEQIEFAMLARARATGDVAFILDPRNSQEILLFTADPELIEVGTIGLVFREDSRFIGRIRITQLGPPLLGTVISLQDGETLSPYDSLVFEFQGGMAVETEGIEGESP